MSNPAKHQNNQQRGVGDLKPYSLRTRAGISTEVRMVTSGRKTVKRQSEQEIVVRTTVSPSIRHHSAWPQLAPYFIVEKCNPGDSKRARFRLELSKMTPGLAKLALGVTVKCCSCGSPIHPIRSRRPPGNKRSKAVGGGLYFAAACPLRRSIGCSRGLHAKAEYLAVRAAIDEVGR